MADQPTIAVIGAGMVGTCCALYLQNEGFAVTMIDRGGPGEAASSGNLGGFGVASCPPLAMPGVLRKVPGMLLDADAPLRIRWDHAARVRIRPVGRPPAPTRGLPARNGGHPSRLTAQSRTDTLAAIPEPHLPGAR